MAIDYTKKEYDKIAKEYSELEDKRLERIYILDPSFMDKIGNVEGKSVLDLACGDGNFTRRFAKLGAREVVGVDLSEEMIKIAEEKTSQEKLSVKYIVGDVLELEKIKEFDLVVAAFLLHYSKTKEELQQMCDNIYKNLKKGGRFVTLNHSPIKPIQDNSEFGVKVEGPENIKEGGEMKVSLISDMKAMCSFTTYFWSKQTYENCLKKAGFKNIKWSPPKVSQEGIEKYGEKLWKDFLKEPYLLFIEAEK